jgi:hypothetical protein
MANTILHSLQVIFIWFKFSTSLQMMERVGPLVFMIFHTIPLTLKFFVVLFISLIMGA